MVTDDFDNFCSFGASNDILDSSILEHDNKICLTFINVHSLNDWRIVFKILLDENYLYCLE